MTLGELKEEEPFLRGNKPIFYRFIRINYFFIAADQSIVTHNDLICEASGKTGIPVSLKDLRHFDANSLECIHLDGGYIGYRPLLQTWAVENSLQTYCGGRWPENYNFDSTRLETTQLLIDFGFNLEK